MVKSFIDEQQKKTCKIIVNTAFVEEFNKEKFITYLGFEVEVKIQAKGKDNNTNISILKDGRKDIDTHSKKNILRNVVIREAIEIENLIFSKIKDNSNFENLNHQKLKEKIESFGFREKIQLFNAMPDIKQPIKRRLEKLRKTRNDFAHQENPPTNQTLLDFLQEIEDLKQQIDQVFF